MESGAFRAAYALLNEYQRAAVDQLDGPLLVIAGPGTGKTQLLSTRVANILLKSDVAAHNVLCLTFTESGVRAMRERLEGMIGPAAFDVTISTYHGFGSELLRNYPQYGGVIGEQAADELTYFMAMRSVQQELPYSNPFKSDFYTKDLLSLISDAKRALLSPDDLKTIAKANLDSIKRLNPIISRIFDGFTRVSKKSASIFEKLAVELESEPKAASLPGGITSYQQRMLSELQEAITQYHETAKGAPLSAFRDRWLARDSGGTMIAQGAAENERMRSVATIYASYLKELSRQSFFDYDDMILKTIAALEAHQDFKYSLAERYQYILLDEFQDTNASQLRLIELLSDNPVNEGRPNIMAVGDDDQAIYSFQGADYSNMSRFTTMFNGVTVISLAHNYRSDKAVLSLAGHISDQIEARLIHTLPGLTKELQAMADTSKQQAIVEAASFDHEALQYAWISEEIARLHQQGIPLSEIAVLAPRHKQLLPLLPYLSAAQLPVWYERRENVLDDPHIEQLIVMARLVRALASLDVTTAHQLWPMVLSYSFWGLPPEMIWQLNWQVSSQKLDWIETLKNTPQTAAIADYFLRLAQLAHELPLEQLIDLLIGGESVEHYSSDAAMPMISPYFDHYFSVKQQQKDSDAFLKLISNLSVLVQRAVAHKSAAGSHAMLSDFLALIDAHRESEVAIINTTPYQNSTDAVQLMTAYKSKGLEFSAVFVIACQEDVWGPSGRQRSPLIKLPPNLQPIRYRSSGLDELRRLFFVALTRAKYRLYLTSFNAYENGAKTTRLRFLLNAPIIKEHTPSITPAALPVTVARHYWQRNHILNSQGSLGELIKPRLERLQLSISNLHQYTDVMYGGPEAFILHGLLRFPRSASPAIHYGNAIHETLNQAHLVIAQSAAVNQKKLLTIFETQLAEKPLSKRDYEQLLERGQTALSGYWQQRATTFAANDLHEQSFRAENVFVDGVPLNGAIDKMTVDRTNKTISVTDFKTGKPHHRWSNSDIRLVKYRQQLMFYKLLVEHSASWRGYQVITGNIEFVEPDDTGTIVTLEHHYDDSQMEDFKAVVRGVWEHIMRLETPNISGYPPSAKGMLAFQQALKSTAIPAA